MSKSLTTLLEEMSSNKQPSDILPVLLLMLSSQKGKNYDVLANLATLVESDTLISLLQVFEGCTIEFPSTSDYRKMMLALMVVYEKQLLDKTYSGALDSLTDHEYQEVLAVYNELMLDKDFTFFIKGLSKNED